MKTLRCPHCQATLRLPAGNTPELMKCPKCNTKVALRRPSNEPPQPPPISPPSQSQAPPEVAHARETSTSALPNESHNDDVLGAEDGPRQRSKPRHKHALLIGWLLFVAIAGWGMACWYAVLFVLVFIDTGKIPTSSPTAFWLPILAALLCGMYSHLLRLDNEPRQVPTHTKK